MGLERVAEAFQRWMTRTKKETLVPPARRVVPTEQPKSSSSEGASRTGTSKSTEAGHIQMKPHPSVGETGAAPRFETASLRHTIRENVAMKSKDMPVSKKLDVLLQEAGPDINPDLAREVRHLSTTLEQPPSRQQWNQIQESLGRISQYSDVKVIEAAKIVQAEVHQYAFSQVLTHAAEYGLTKTDAPQVVSTFQEASVARYRDLKRAAPESAPNSDVQQSIESAFVEAEIQREWETVAQIAKDAQARKEIQETDEKTKKLREAEDVSVDEAKERIKELIKDYPAEDKAFMESLLSDVETNRQAASFLLTIAEAGPDGLASPAYLYAKGGQWRAQTYEQLAKADLPYNKQMLEVRAIQNKLASKVARQIQEAPRPLKHAVDFRGVDKRMVDISMRFEGTFGGVPYSSPGSEWWAEGPTNKGALYGPARTINNHGVVPVTELDTFLQDAQRRIDLDPQGAQSLTLMNQLEQEFRQHLRELTDPRRVGGAITIPDSAFEYYKDVSQNMRDLVEKSRDHVNLGLSGDYKEVIWRDGPEKAIYTKLREVEQYSKSYEGDTPMAQTAVRTLEQMQSYITDPRFANEWRRDLLAQGLSLADANAKIEQFMNRGLETLSNNIDWRRNLVKLYNAYTAQGLSEEKLAQLFSPFGSEGYLGTLGLFEGKVAAAYDYFDAVLLSAHREHHSDDLIWLSPDKLKDLYRKATQEMKDGAVAIFDGLKQYEIEEIAFLAQESHFISGRTVLAMNRGLAPMEQSFYAPGTRPDKQHPFGGGGGSNIERAASARKPLRFGFLRWNLENEGVRMNLDSDATFAARGNDVERVVDDLIAEAQRRGRMEDLVRYTADISVQDLADPNHTGIIEGRLGATYLNRDPEGNVRPAPRTLAEAASNIPVLKERLMSKIGLQIVESSVMDYTMLDSGPMCYGTRNKLTEMFTYSDQLAISMQVRDAYASVLGAKTHDAKHANIHTLEGVLKKAARYNPTDLLNGHIDTRNFATDDWFATLNNAEITSFLHPDQVAAGGVQSAGDLVKVVTRVDANIESLLKAEVRNGNHLQRIDWTQPLKAEHREIVRRALRATTGKSAGTDADIGLENFIKMKSNMAVHVGSDHMIHEATKADFIVKYGYQTNNSADLWLDLAEDPRFGDKTAGSINKLSEELGRRGSGDLMVRFHGDTETALKAKEILVQAIQTLDWKSYAKAIAEIRFMTRNVYGQPWDGRAIMYYSAGLLEGIAQDKLTEWSFDIFRVFRMKDSKIRRILNSEHAPSDSIEDRHEKIGEIEQIFVQSLESVDHELAEYFLQYVGMTKGLGPGMFGLENDILWKKRLWRVTAFGMVLLAVGLMKEGTEELGVGGGGGGGGGGAHH